jgi:hypothetical protein
MPEEIRITELEQRIENLEKMLADFIGSDRYTTQKDLQIFDGRKIIAGTANGLIIASAGTEKLGFFGNTPVVQFDNPTGRQDTSGSSGVDMSTGHRFNGNTGSDYYSVGDIVFALKQYGILKDE